MNIKSICFIVFSVLFAVNVNAAEPIDINAIRAQVAKDYHALKAKADMGTKVRVIVKVRGVSLGQPASNKVPVKFKNTRVELEQKGLKSKRNLPRIGVLVFEVDGIELDTLIDSGLVEKVIEDVAEPPGLVQSIDFIDAELVHSNGFTGTGQAVVILDTGVETNHAFYSGRVVEGACFSSNSSVSTSLCPNGLETQFGVGASIDCSWTGISSCDHGTHVTGIAAGVNQNMSGVAPGANIVAVQVFSDFPASYSGCGGQRCVLSWNSDQLAALEWVLNNSTTPNKAAINMSIGGGNYTTYCDTDVRAGTIQALRNAGIATVISAGNSGSSNSVGAPGCISAAITTGSTLDTSNSISWFSNSATMVDIFAPGSSITSSIVGGNYGTKNGTSMAAPHVTGSFAVMRAINPAATVADIEQSLETHGVQIIDSRNNLTFPRLDLNSSVISFYGAPIAKIDQDSYSVMINTNTEFTANASSDPNNIPLTYIWDFGDGITGYQTTIPSVFHTYTQSGTYDLGLLVTNGARDSEDFAKVTVYDPAVISIIVSSLLLN